MKKVYLILVLALAFLSAFYMNSASAYNKFQMLNATGRTIYCVYFVPKHYDDWGNDKLNGLWHSGNFLTLNTPKWRYWSLKIVFKDGNYSYWDGDNAIDSETWGTVIIKPNGHGGYTLSRQN